MMNRQVGAATDTHLTAGAYSIIRMKTGQGFKRGEREFKLLILFNKVTPSIFTQQIYTLFTAFFHKFIHI